MAHHRDQVHEMQGLYGPFTIAERVVQKIWLRRDFAHQVATLSDGRRLKILSPGTWNLLGGPDFRGAKLEINGQAVTGDIEVHFHLQDWRAHGHDSDPAYNRVVLHVVMFPLSERSGGVLRQDGVEIPALILLPHLHRSLEEYASDDALENITARNSTEWIAELLTMSAEQARKRLEKEAARRWSMKVHFASLRIKQLGWTEAVHHTALEILGYRHNRAAMLTVAAMHPLREWKEGLDLAAVFLARAGQWQVQGVRPANQPRVRLRQYTEWVRRVPDWPTDLRKLFREFPVEGSSSTAPFRKKNKMPGLRDRISRDIMADSISGSRLDTMICDAFLPLLAADTGRNCREHWFHWYLGDIPLEVRKSLGLAGISGSSAFPHSHGWAQGLLGWMHQRAASASG